MSINLAFVTQDFPPEMGGIETYSIELAKRFALKCNHFFVLAPDKPEASKIDKNLNFNVQRIATPNPILGLKALPEAPVLFRKFHTTHVMHAQWQTLPLSILARKLGIVQKIFAAAHGRDLLFNPFYKFPIAARAYESYKRWLLSQVDLFFPVSAYMANLLKYHGVHEQRINIIPNGTDPAAFYPTNTNRARQSLKMKANKVLLSAARLVSKKGIDTALTAFKRVLKNHPDSCYIIAGEGPQEQYLKELTTKLHIADAVKFVGRIAHADMINYYNACDIFVMPSKTELPDVEGFGIVFLEANACEKPVIGSFSGGIPSAVVNGKTGILVDESDPEALANAMNTLFDDPELASQMGKRGRIRVEQTVNWDITAEKMIRFIKHKI